MNIVPSLGALKGRELYTIIHGVTNHPRREQAQRKCSR